MTGAPWYWTDAMFDHDACFLVLGVGRSGNIHYVDGTAHPRLLPKPACSSGAAHFKELEFHGQVATCRNCCSMARHNRHRIKELNPRSYPGVVGNTSRTNFIRREQRRRIDAGS